MLTGRAGAHAAAHQHGGIGHNAHHRHAFARRSLQLLERQARGHGHHHGILGWFKAFEQIQDGVGLHTREDIIRAVYRRRIIAGGGDAISVLKFLAARFGAIGNRDIRARKARCHESRGQSLTDLSAA